MSFNPEYGLKFLRTQDDPEVWYCIVLDPHGGTDFYGTIYKEAGTWQYAWPSEHRVYLCDYDYSYEVDADLLMQISEFMQSLKKYGPNGMFEMPTEDGYEYEDYNEWFPAYPK